WAAFVLPSVTCIKAACAVQVDTLPPEAENLASGRISRGYPLFRGQTAQLPIRYGGGSRQKGGENRIRISGCVGNSPSDDSTIKFLGHLLRDSSLLLKISRIYQSTHCTLYEAVKCTVVFIVYGSSAH